MKILAIRLLNSGLLALAAHSARLAPLSMCLAFAAGGLCAGPDVERIIERSVKANQKDWTAAPDYSFQETDRDSDGSKTFRVVMIDGSPYQTLLSVNGRALTSQELEKQHASMETETARRRSETQQQRERRIAKYQTERRRDHLLMQQLTNAFTFRLAGERNVGPYQTYYFKATPRKGYQPPNLESEVLPGMEGELWIDKKTFQWVKVCARVIKPVAIAGFLAQVEPGTSFELENTPVAPGIWLPKHYVMKSRSKILFLIGHDTQANETYFDYRNQVSP